ncbi:MAG TPA: FtsX-like permease family protein, partial [Candidatus Krumholzibacterium sp.]|nr:FtsX-like permease family protein [Candidatus Krumholzibacterium sp.]
DIFTFPLKQGDPKTALDGVSSVVITEEIAEKYFGDRNPIGEIILYRGETPFKITGVMENIPENTHIKIDFLMNFEFLGVAGVDISQDRWDDIVYYTYILLKDESSIARLDAKITDYLERKSDNPNVRLSLQPLGSIHLHSDSAYDMNPAGDIKYVYIFSAVAFFILLIACINFINLTTATSTNRLKEIGIRKVVGADKINLIFQFLGETFMTSLFSIILGVELVTLALPVFNGLTGKSISSATLYSPDILIALAGIVVLTGSFSGVYSALFLSSLRPLQILRKNSFATGFGGHTVTLRKVLVVFQFSLSIFLIVSTLTIHSQLDFIRNKELGFDREHMVYFPVRGDAATSYGAMKEELLNVRGIEHVTRAGDLPTYVNSSTSGIDWEGKRDEDNLQVYKLDVDHDFIETFSLALNEGKGFSELTPVEGPRSYIL